MSVGPGTALDLPDVERREVLAQAEGASAAQLTRLFDVAQRTVADVRMSEQPRYALEIGLLKGAFLAPGAEVSELLARLEELSGGVPPPAPPTPTSPPSSTSRSSPT